MKKIYPILIKGLQNAIAENFFEANRHADKVLENIFKENKKWGSRDRNFISESFYEIIRWKRHFEFFINEPISNKNIDKIIFAYLVFKNYNFDYSLFLNIDFDYIKNRIKLDFPSKAIKYSIPDWLEKKFINEVENWEDEISEMNKKTFTVLRVSNKIDTLELKEKLLLKDVETEILENSPKTLILKKRKKIDNLNLFENGLFEIQDANSQKIINYLDIKKNQIVIDTCAGAGGKTLQIGEILENTGTIYAFDIHEKKLLELEKRAKRNNIKNIKPHLIEKESHISIFKNIADRVLIDAPCSGLGVLKRNPDAKWKLSEKFIDDIKITQKEILQKYSELVKVNGKILYSTCSILYSENEKQVEIFLKNNSNFRLILEKNLRPSETKFDGFYFAVMERII